MRNKTFLIFFVFLVVITAFLYSDKLYNSLAQISLGVVVDDEGDQENTCSDGLEEYSPGYYYDPNSSCDSCASVGSCYEPSGCTSNNRVISTVSAPPNKCLYRAKSDGEACTRNGEEGECEGCVCDVDCKSCCDYTSSDPDINDTAPGQTEGVFWNCQNTGLENCYDLPPVPQTAGEIDSIIGNSLVSILKVSLRANLSTEKNEYAQKWISVIMSEPNDYQLFNIYDTPSKFWIYLTQMYGSGLYIAEKDGEKHLYSRSGFRIDDPLKKQVTFFEKRSIFVYRKDGELYTKEKDSSGKYVPVILNPSNPVELTIPYYNLPGKTYGFGVKVSTEGELINYSHFRLQPTVYAVTPTSEPEIKVTFYDREGFSKDLDSTKSGSIIIDAYNKGEAHGPFSPQKGVFNYRKEVFFHINFLDNNNCLLVRDKGYFGERVEGVFGFKTDGSPRLEYSGYFEDSMNVFETVVAGDNKEYYYNINLVDKGGLTNDFQKTETRINLYSGSKKVACVRLIINAQRKNGSGDQGGYFDFDYPDSCCVNPQTTEFVSPNRFNNQTRVKVKTIPGTRTDPNTGATQDVIVNAAKIRLSFGKEKLNELIAKRKQGQLTDLGNFLVEARYLPFEIETVVLFGSGDSDMEKLTKGIPKALLSSQFKEGFKVLDGIDSQEFEDKKLALISPEDQARFLDFFERKLNEIELPGALIKYIPPGSKLIMRSGPCKPEIILKVYPWVEDNPSTERDESHNINRITFDDKDLNIIVRKMIWNGLIINDKGDSDTGLLNLFQDLPNL